MTSKRVGAAGEMVIFDEDFDMPEFLVPQEKTIVKAIKRNLIFILKYLQTLCQGFIRLIL